VVKSRSSQTYQQINTGTGMQVYPNPSDQSSTIAWDGQYSRLCVYASTGKLVYQTNVSGHKTTLKTSTLPPGIYTIQLLGNEGPQTSRLVVERNP
jgi:hypothetical protein